MTDNLKEAQEHLEALETFLGSPAHKGYVLAKQVEIQNVEARILLLPPVNRENIANSLMAYGELDMLKEAVTTFEDARVTLKKRIDDMVERQNQNATETRI